MGLQTWAGLEKSADDDETIEEAIDRLIAVHEASPTSHLGEGESLQSHKSEEVIDHPAGSVLADKQTSIETIVRSSFSSLDSWVGGGSYSNPSLGVASIGIESGGVENSKLVTDLLLPYPFLDVTYDLMFQVVAQFIIDDDDFSFCFGQLNDITTNLHGIGFVFEGGELKGHAQNSTEEKETSAITIDLSLAHVYRYNLQASTGKIKFFIDGAEVGEIDVPAGAWADEYVARFQLYTTGTGIVTMNFGDLTISRALVN